MPLTTRPETRLRAVRKALGLSQAELSRRTGVDQAAVCRIELGDTRPWPKFRRDAAAALGVDEGLLFADLER
jgi:transcriptional regulator with XRE-family HTH domain